MTKIFLSSWQYNSSLPSLHSIIPSQGIAMILRSMPGKRSSMHSIVAPSGKVSLHISKISSSPYLQWKIPSQILSEFALYKKMWKLNSSNVMYDYHINQLQFLFTFWDTGFAFIAKKVFFKTACRINIFRTIKRKKALQTIHGISLTKWRKCVHSASIIRSVIFWFK